MFKCEGCKDNVSSMPIKVVTAVKIHDFEKTGRVGYDVAKEHNMCLPCAVGETQLDPKRLQSRGRSFTKAVRDKLLSIGLVLSPDPDEAPSKAEALGRLHGLNAERATLRDEH